MGIALVQVGLGSDSLTGLPQGDPHKTIRWEPTLSAWVKTGNLLNIVTAYTSENDMGNIAIGFGSFTAYNSSYGLTNTRLVIKGIANGTTTQSVHIINNIGNDVLRIRDDGNIGINIPLIGSISAKLHSNGSTLFEGLGTEPYPIPYNGLDAIQFNWSTSMRSVRIGEDLTSSNWIESNVGKWTFGFGLSHLILAEGGVAFGSTHEIESSWSNISGGTYHTIGVDSKWSGISSGATNTIENSMGSYIGGGFSNQIINQSGNSFIGGGYGNIIDGLYPFEPISTFSVALCENSIIIGGFNNKILKMSGNSAINGGSYNIIKDFSAESVISGGGGNIVHLWSQGANIVGGYTNTISYKSGGSTITGGWLNKINWDTSYVPTYPLSITPPLDHPHDGLSVMLKYNSFNTINGGYNNTITASIFSYIEGGNGNVINGHNYTTILAGENITSTDSYTVYGPKFNINKEYLSTSLPGQTTKMLWHEKWVTPTDAFNYNWLYWETRPILSYRETTTYNANDTVLWDDGLKEWYVGPPASAGLVQFIVSVTYSELITLMNTSQLSPGQNYLITDFQTIYDQPDYTSTFGLEKVIVVTKYGAIEPIVVTATSTTTLSIIASSTVYPDDYIEWIPYYYYDTNTFTNIYTTEVMLQPIKGRIIKRRDNVNNETSYDHREVLFKRYQSYDKSTQLTGTSFGVVGTSLTGPNLDTLFLTELSIGSIIIINNETFKILSISDDYNAVVEINTGIGVISNTMYLATPSGKYNSYSDNNINADWVEVLTFGTDCTNNIISTPFNLNLFFILPNNVFGNGCYLNILKGICYNNTFDIDNINNNVINTTFTNNILGNNFRYNNINSEFEGNIIGNNFDSNTINKSFTYNIINNNFNYNIFDSNFNYNEIGYNFQYNNILNTFQYNIIGNNFVTNIINGNFGNNVISNDFSKNNIYTFETNNIADGFTANTIKTEFGFNTVGTGFTNNDIGTHFFDNIVGDSFQYNTTGEYLDSNIFGNGCMYNNIESFFQFNTTGDSFSSNKIGNNSIYNTIGSSFNLNTIGKNFSYNIITNSCTNNTIGNTFQSNILQDGFTYNVIGDTFQGCTINTSFNNNNISNDFINNQIDQAFENNIISNAFINNSIGTYMFRNKIFNVFSNNTILDTFHNNVILNTFDNNTIGADFTNNTIQSSFSSNVVTTGFKFNMIQTQVSTIDFTTATFVYDSFNCTIFARKDYVLKLSYFDDSDILTIVLPTD